MQSVAPIMVQQGGGVIVNVGSILGKIVVPSLGMVGSSGGYTASKFALGAFSAAARMELAAQGVQIVTVLPGVTATEFDARFLLPPGMKTSHPPQRSGLLGRTSAQRVGERIVRAIIRNEREVYITWRDRLIVLGATAFPGLWAWGLTRLRGWRTAEKRRWLRSGALLLGTLALGAAAGAALLKRLVGGK
jgi:short-subunit dehydrogenase